MEDALLLLLKGSVSYLLADLLFGTFLSPSINTKEIPVQYKTMPLTNTMQQSIPAPTLPESQKTSKKTDKFTSTDQISETKVLLPLKRLSARSIDNFKYNSQKLLPNESTIELKKKILCIDKSSKQHKKYPLYGLTSPVPYPTRYSIPSQKF